MYDDDPDWKIYMNTEACFYLKDIRCLLMNLKIIFVESLDFLNLREMWKNVNMNWIRKKYWNHLNLKLYVILFGYW